MSMKGASAELQEISIIGLINDPYLLAKCIPEITEKFFSNPMYKLIYKALKKYYNKYLTVPTEKELSVMISDLHKEDYGKLEDINKIVEKLYSTKISSEDYVYDQITEFIKRNKIESSLNKVVNYINGGSIDLDTVANEFRDSLNITFNRAPLLNLSDITKVSEVREEALGPTENPVMIKFFLDPVNWCMQYKALPPGTLNMVVAPPGRGKTTTLINQGVYTAQQGFNILHVFLGDMSRYDGLLRYLSCFTGVPTSKLVDLSDEELKKFIQKYNMSGILSHIYIASYAADELTPNQLVEEITSMQKDNKVHFHVIIVDYDENFANATNSMYESGGSNYNRLALFSVINKSVMFIAAQPKPEYWSKEVLPLECAAESSKKQKIIDLMLTIGKPKKDSKVGTVNIAKNRRGDDCKYVRVKFDGANARVKAITEEEYSDGKKADNYSSKEIGG